MADDAGRVAGAGVVVAHGASSGGARLDAALDAAEAAAALCALAGPRRGDVLVVAADAPPVAARALRAATGSPPDGSGDSAGAGAAGGARLGLAGGSAGSAQAVAERLAPGGRLVALAPDEAAARALAARLGLAVRALAPLAVGVAWAAVLPAPPATRSGAGSAPPA